MLPLPHVYTIPAPMTTLDTPFHILLPPSTVLTLENAFQKPVYSPPSVGFKTWSRVCLVLLLILSTVAQISSHLEHINGVHNGVFLYSDESCATSLLYGGGGPYSDAGKGACSTILQDREVRR